MFKTLYFLYPGAVSLTPLLQFLIFRLAAINSALKIIKIMMTESFLHAKSYHHSNQEH